MKKRLTLEDRIKIEEASRLNLGYKKISAHIGIPTSTIQSEIYRYKRLFPSDILYDARKAHESKGSRCSYRFGIASENAKQLELIADCVANTKCSIELDPNPQIASLEAKVASLEMQIQILFNTIKELKSG